MKASTTGGRQKARRATIGIASVVLTVLATLIVSTVVVASCASLLVTDSGSPRSQQVTPDLPALCAVFGPLHGFEGRASYSIEAQVRRGTSGFADEHGQAITGIATLAAYAGVEVVGDDAATANALARYLLETGLHQDDPSRPQPRITPDVLAGARRVDATVQAGRCEGWQEP